MWKIFKRVWSSIFCILAFSSIAGFLFDRTHADIVSELCGATILWTFILGFGGTIKLFWEENSVPGFEESFNELATAVHENAVQHGWWEKDRSDGELIALMHSELSEALEALRDGNPKDDKLPEFLNVEVELGDVIIRIMDAAKKKGWRVAEAIVAKHEYNKTRPFKHGGKEF